MLVFSAYVLRSTCCAYIGVDDPYAVLLHAAVYAAAAQLLGALLCERNAMLEQLLLDIRCGPHLCACMPAVCTMPAPEDDMCLLHLYCCMVFQHLHI